MYSANLHLMRGYSRLLRTDQVINYHGQFVCSGFVFSGPNNYPEHRSGRIFFYVGKEFFCEDDFPVAYLSRKGIQPEFVKFKNEISDDDLLSVLVGELYVAEIIPGLFPS